jgi:hypothetical protein
MTAATLPIRTRSACRGRRNALCPFKRFFHLRLMARTRIAAVFAAPPAKDDAARRDAR